MELTQEAEPRKAKCPAKRAIQGLSHSIKGSARVEKRSPGDSRGPGKPVKEKCRSRWAVGQEPREAWFHTEPQACLVCL